MMLWYWPIQLVQEEEEEEDEMMRVIKDINFETLQAGCCAYNHRIPSSQDTMHPRKYSLY